MWTIQVPAETEERLARQAASYGVEPDEYAIALLEAFASGDSAAKRDEILQAAIATAKRRRPEDQAAAAAPEPRALLRVSRKERDTLLSAQAERAAVLYAVDLARPAAERELTAFTALDEEPFRDSYHADEQR